VELHVTCPLELFVDHIVHPATRIHESGRDNRQTTAILDIPRGAEETLGG
jgi:hypothetical protein